jgi:23S rRNA pseudouridine2605 synthase
MVDHYDPLTKEQVDAISALPYITLSDKRYMTAGFSDDYYRVHDLSAYSSTMYYDYTRRCVIEGTLREVQFWEDLPVDTPNYFSLERGYNKFVLDDVTLLAGKCARIPQESSLVLPAYDFLITDYSHGLRSSSDAHITRNYVYDTEYLKTLVPGERYAFVTRCEHAYGYGHYFSDMPCREAQPIGSDPGALMQSPAFEPLRELIEIINADVCTFDVVYTQDMRAIMRFSDVDMTIIEGRGLTSDDSLAPASGDDGAPPCVISSLVAETYKLRLGDLLTLHLGSELFEQYKGLGAIAFAPERYSPPVKTVTLEIVGIYEDGDSESKRYENPNWNYSYSTVFVPITLLPVDESELSSHLYSPAEFSYIVDNAWDFSAFLAEAEPLYEELGLTLIFNDRGWPAVESSYREAERLSVIGVAAFSAAVFAATLFIVYLYISRRRKEYAIMRALGATKPKAAFALAIPLALIAALSILAGSAAAWANTARTIGNNDALSLLEEFAVDTSIPAAIAVLCIIAELALTLLFTYALLRRMGAKKPLALLQDSGAAIGRQRVAGPVSGAKASSGKPAGSGQAPKSGEPAGSGEAQKGGQAPKGGKPAGSGQAPKSGESSENGLPKGGESAKNGMPKSGRVPPGTSSSARKAAAAAQRAPSATLRAPIAAQNAASATLPAPAPRQGAGFAARYIARHIRRAAWKSALTILLAALLFCAIGQLRLTRQTYYDMVNDYTLTARLLGGLPLKTAVRIAGSNYVTDMYYESARAKVDADAETTMIVVTNDIARFTGEETGITYSEGYDGTCMGSLGNIVIVGEAFFRAHGLDYGDTILISVEGTYAGLTGDYIYAHRKYDPDSDLSDDEILQLYSVFIDRTIRIKSRPFTIAGVITTPSGDYDKALFTPGVPEAWEYGVPDKVVVAEYSLSDNSLADEFRDYCAQTANVGGRATDSIRLFIDTEKIENLRNTLNILETVYPAALAAALLIGAFLCCLVILQSAKEASIMRMLGTSRRQTGSLLSLEQALLCVVGLALGCCAMLVYKGRALAQVSADAALFSSAYFAAVLIAAAICSALTTRRSALELLQVKE